MKDRLRKFIAGLFEKWIIAVGTALVLTFGSAVLGTIKVFFSGPAEIEAMNQRITNDSLIAEQRLQDSCAMFRMGMANLSNRLAEVEKENRKNKSKLKSKLQ